MYKDHPPLEELDLFFRSTSPANMAPAPLAVVRHLLAGCSVCCKELENAGWSGPRLDRFLRLAATKNPVQNTDYGLSFAAAERKLEAYFATESPLSEPPAKMLSKVYDLSIEAQIRRISTDPQFWHPGIVKALIERSHTLRYEDPAAMLHLALLARLAAENCSTQAAGSAERLADSRTQAWGHLGNSLRVNGRMLEAEEALDKAQAYRRQGTGDPPLHARLLEQWASLRYFQRRFAESIAMADDASRIYRELGDKRALAASLLHKAIASIYAGEIEPAIRILNQAIALVDPQETPQVLLAACHNLIRCYIDADKPEQALSLYFETRELYQEFDGASTILLKTAWQEGQILRDLGHLRAAEIALQRARQGFLERGLLFEVAVVSLDLAAVFVRLGKVEEVKQIATEAIPIFRSLRVERETLGSLLQLQQAAGQEKKALELIRLLSSQIEPLAKSGNTR